MVVVEYSYDEIKSKVNLTKEKIIDILNTIGAPTEEDEETKLIKSEITPNRPDWYSLEGLVRSIKTYEKSEEFKYHAKKSDYKVIIEKGVAKIRPYTVCAVIKGIKFDDQKIKEIVQLQEKLGNTMGRKIKKLGIGFYPLQTIEFPIIYTTRKPHDIKYRPLGFDKEVSASEILKTHKKGEQYGHIIEKFEEYPVFLDNKKRIMCLIPIVNSAETGKVDTNTKDVFVEVTGIEFEAVSQALNIICCSLSDMGGEIYQIKTEYVGDKKQILTPNLEEREMNYDIKKAQKLIGMEISEQDVEKLLKRMGYNYKNKKITIPPYRADILGEIDITEDLAIAIGYNNIKPTMPNFFTSGKKIEKEDKYHATMRGLGFLETKTYILTNERKIEDVEHSEKVVEIANQSNEEFTIVRPNLIASIIETFEINKTKGLPQKIYEIGETHNGKTNKKKLIFGVMNNEIEFSQFRGYLQTLSREIGFEFGLNQATRSPFDKQICAQIEIDGKIRGIVGKIDQQTLDKRKIDFQIMICELDLE